MSILPSHAKVLSLRVIYGASTLFPTDWQDLGGPAWRLWWTTERGIRIGHPRGTLEVPVRQVVLLPAGGTWQVSSQGRRRLLFIHLDLPTSLSASLAAGGPLVPQVLPRDDLFDRLAEAADTSRGVTPPGWAEALSWAALARWLEGLDPVVRGRITTAHEEAQPLAPILRHIDEHLAERLSPAVLAAALGISDDTLARLMRRHLGTTTSRWIRLRRCTRAAELLGTTALDLDTVARQCGFANRFHFTRHFTVFSGGLPPAAYRRQVCGL